MFGLLRSSQFKFHTQAAQTHHHRHRRHHDHHHHQYISPLNHGRETSMSVADLAASALLRNCELRAGVPSSGIIPQQCVSYPNVCEEEEDKNLSRKEKK